MNGAVQTSWNPPAAFQAYKSGILEGFGSELAQGKDSGKPAHSSVIIGWKTEAGKPVWIVRNTHGAHFGMEGDLLVPRGGNAFSIETDLQVYQVESGGGSSGISSSAPTSDLYLSLKGQK